MNSFQHNRFERGILKVIALIGLVRFSIALILNDTLSDGYTDFYMDLATALVFLIGFILLLQRSSNKLLIAFFFAPLILLLWISFYFFDGLASSNEINAFAIVIILSLTIQGRLTWVFVGTFLLGVFLVLFFVERDNLTHLNPSDYHTGTATLLLVTLANIWMTFHAKNKFDSSRQELKNTNQELKERAEEIMNKKEELTAQNKKLNTLKSELEEKVLARTDELMKQKEAIEQYLQLTLNELMRPYEQTITAINDLVNTNNDEMIEMMKVSGLRLAEEVEKLKERLLNSHE